MGRRKERRLAAMSASGRRVKLDLFAEPSGDLDGSSTLEEVGGDEDSKTHTKSDSPSGSGWLWYWEQSNGYQTTPAPAIVLYCVNFQPVLTYFWRRQRWFGDHKGFYQIGQQAQNPLLLLEQYSDEELDEDSNEGHHHADDASVAMDEESKAASGEEAGDREIHLGKESSQNVEQFLMEIGVASQDAEKESITGINSNDLRKEENKMEEAGYSVAPDEHLVGDVSSGWKKVLHEESNQYYYWNVVTGETSWEVPDVVAQETVEASAEKVVGDAEGKTDVATGTCKPSMYLDMENDDITTRELDVDSKINSQTAGSVDQGTRMDRSNEGFKSDSFEDNEGNRDANQDNRTSVVGGSSTDSQSATDLYLQLIRHCESLLDRLNSEKCLNCCLEDQDLKLKCKLEIEIRLADINALASHGSSLLPFWLHSEAQLKRLEAAVDIVIQRVNSASVCGFQATLESHEGAGADTEVDSFEKKALFVGVESHAGDTHVKSTFEVHNTGATTMEHVSPVWCSDTFPVVNVGGKSENPGTEKGRDLNIEPVHHSVEDVDMDVDMEVEDTSSIKSPRRGAVGVHCQFSTDLPEGHNTLSDWESTLPGQVLGSPPDDEWIPPPPPDNEPFPPPPPDDEPYPPPLPEEPPETSYPPAHLGSVQAFPYSEPYTLSYPGSGLEYYVQTNPEVSGNTLYTHSEGDQVALSHVPHYYEAAANVYAVAPVLVNPVEPTTYYGLQNTTINHVPLMNGRAESSGTQSESVPEETVTVGSLDSHPESGSNLLLKNNIHVDKSYHGPVNVSPEVPEAQSSICDPATSTVTNGISVSLSDTASVSAAEATAATKSQPKVSRAKKRTVAVVSTLRSNKKVSSLVDKWKAAKEELHEEEEEPEDPYEILEKKRKREIEKWRAQQIASGEAKVNANFQPLGGDWRERVKRKRAEKMKESGQTSPDVATNGNQKTDLLKLSKGLPSGWQVYWDDSSKQVYYGNVLTSETTWIRPTE